MLFGKGRKHLVAVLLARPKPFWLRPLWQLGRGFTARSAAVPVTTPTSSVPTLTIPTLTVASVATLTVASTSATIAITAVATLTVATAAAAVTAIAARSTVVAAAATVAAAAAAGLRFDDRLEILLGREQFESFQLRDSLAVVDDR